MALHDSLRELVAVRGAGVVDEAEELRGALDDFLSEDEATLGELNLLVDAVRLGALRRLLDVMDHGAEPEAAIREAGGALARDRGTDDPTRSCWALATLGFALGTVDESLVRMFRGDAGTMPAPHPPTGPHGRAPEPAYPAPDDRLPTRVLSEQAPVASHPAPPPTSQPNPPVPPTSQPNPPVPPTSHPAPPPTSQPAPTSPPAPTSQPAPPPQPVSVQPPAPTVEVGAPPPPQQYAGPVPPVIPEEKSSRAGSFVLVVLVALLLGGLVAAGFILLRSDGGGDDDPAESDDPATTDGGQSPTGKGRDEPPLPDGEMLVPYVVDEVSRIFRVDAASGRSEPVTPEGIDARLPTISPDRTTMTYQVGRPPSVVMAVDLVTGEERALFGADSDCASAGRPAWSPDGSRVVLQCDPGGDGEPDGIWLANADGSGVTGPLVDNSNVSGSPTWISDTEFVYGVDDLATDTTFWRTDVDGGSGEQLSIDVEGHLSHIDWSPAQSRLLLLASPGDAEEGAIWTVDIDGLGPALVDEGPFAHPVWAPDGQSIGVTLVDDSGVEVLGTVPLDDPSNPVIVPDAPPGEVGIPVWSSR